MNNLREAAQAVVDDAQVVSSADRIIVPQYVVSCDVLDALRSALAEPEWIPVEGAMGLTDMQQMILSIAASGRRLHCDGSFCFEYVPLDIPAADVDLLCCRGLLERGGEEVGGSYYVATDKGRAVIMAE